MKPTITFDDFQKIDIRTGTILTAELNPKAKKAAYVMTIDFGEELGIKTSSAQLTQNYQPDDLVNRQILAVVNFPPMRIAGVKSEVLVLGCVGDESLGTVLIQPNYNIPNGTPLAIRNR